MISVEEAWQIIQSCKPNYGEISVPFEDALGRVLAEDIRADRDLPPFNRVAMDGIAIRYDDYLRGNRHYAVSQVVGAGDAPPDKLDKNTCFEIMTGASLPSCTDTVVPYEHLNVKDGTAEILKEVTHKGQNIHFQGTDKKSGTLLIKPGIRIGPVEISVAASVGKSGILVKKLPKVAIFSSGDELVDVDKVPLPHQIRRSNSHLIRAALKQTGIDTAMVHLADNKENIQEALETAVQENDILILSGGVSMGKYDYLPEALESVGVKKLFHKVKQRPGKPFWFGSFGEQGVVFALPGNPVSTHFCLVRYVLPWLEETLGNQSRPPILAVLDEDFTFEPPLQLYKQVKIFQNETAQLMARSVVNKGSGDFSSLLEADGFLELPADQQVFKAGEKFRFWEFRH